MEQRSGRPQSPHPDASANTEQQRLLEIRMHPVYRSSTLVVSMLAAVSLTAAQPAAESSHGLTGHWEGAVQTPESPINVGIDLAKNSRGEFVGTLGNPAQNLKGLVLSDIAVDGKAIRFQVKGTPGERAFKGTLSADGSTMSGEYTQAGYLMPFAVTRTGDARIETAPTIAAVGKELEGTWRGTASSGGELRMVLANQPDGTCTGSIVNVDEGLEIPISAISQKGSTVTLEVRAVGASFSGELTANTELSGTLKEGGSSRPLVFKRGATHTKN
jgi:hypothetical protein